MSELGLKNVSDQDLFEEVLRRFQCSLRPTGSASFIGPRASGKSTQAEQLARTNCWCIISMEGILQEWGQRRGNAKLTDEDFAEIVRGRIMQPRCERGAVFDGVPRTVGQANALDEVLKKENTKVHGVVNMKCPETVLLERIVEKNKKKGVIKSAFYDEGKDLERASKEIDQYYENIAGVIKHYEYKNSVLNINATENPRMIWNQLQNYFNKILTKDKQ